VHHRRPVVVVGGEDSAGPEDAREASGRFRFTREIVLHVTEEGSAERLMGMTMSFGPLAVLLAEGVSEEELALPKPREVASRVLGIESATFYFGYRVRIVVK
jgi:hypothetical protein